MKRFLILILALLLIAGTFACGGKNDDKTTPEQPTAKAEATAAPTAAAETTPAPVETPEPTEETAPEPVFSAGEYGIVSYEVEGTVFEGEMLIMTGIANTYLTLNEDMTGTLVMMGQASSITWAHDGTVMYNGFPYCTMHRIDAETITLDYGSCVMTLKRDVVPSTQTPAETEAPVETEAPAETEAPVETEAPAVTEAPAPSGEGEFPGAPYGSSDGVIDRAKLAGFYRWMHELPSDFLYAMTFDELSAAVGKQGCDKQDNDGKTHAAYWTDGDRAFVTVTFKVRDNDTWTCTSITISGIASDEYNVADVSGFPKIASSTPAGTNPTEKQTLQTKVGFSGPKVNVAVDLPTKNWYPDAGSSSIYIYCAPNAERADRSHSYFKIECKESLDKINFYKDSFENLTELAPRTIGGIEMQGRSYKYIGMNWIEYYGEIAEGVWVSVKLTGVDLSEGTETEAILLSMAFALQ